MRIKEIVDQMRRDFTAIYECEFCGHESKGYGYDDGNFHDNVIPNMKCKACNKSNHESYKAAKTKYPDGVQV